ncbi:MAG: hypothetical protein KF858_05025 [Candidatus Sumerlaeia bacterium]|nr:hypothetical protein [Candidatus Sumerlaeia bacterium]
MAQYEITHSCGCNQTHKLFGPHAERERKIAWMESFPCSTCERARRLEIASSQEAEMSLPALTGSDKQIAWARALRSEWISESVWIADRLSHREKADLLEKLLEYRTQVLTEKVAAGWWIDGRRESVYPGTTIFGDHWTVLEEFDRGVLPKALK